MIESFKLPTITPETISGAICSFNDEYGSLPLKSCTSLISGYQEGTGTPSPDNVRPLHAFSSASLGKCDNNTASLWTIDNSFNGDVDFNQNVNRINLNDSYGYTFSADDNGYLKIDGTSTSANNKLFYENDIANKEHKFLVMSENELPNGLSLSHSYNANIRKAGIIKGVVSGNTRLLFYFSFNTGVVADNFETHLNVIDLTQMFGSTIADYIYNLEQTETGAGVAFFKSLYPNSYYPYNTGTKQLVGDTLATFTFGQTIYQGSIDWKRGVVVATWGIVDLGSLNWSSLGSNLHTVVTSDLGIEPFEYLCDSYKILEPQVINDNSKNYVTGFSRTGVRGLRVHDDNIDLSTVQTYLTGKHVCYPLATPIEIPLGGINLLTQQGVNNIFADCGDTEVQRLKVN